MRACAVEIHFNISQEPPHTNIYKKNAVPQNHGADFVRARAVETHVKLSQEPVYTKIYRKNAAAQIEPGTRTHILCEPAQSKRMSGFHESHFIRKITEKNAAAQSEHPDQAPAFTATVRYRKNPYLNPSVRTYCLGKKHLVE